jgi:hypothetical protein
MGKRNTCHRYFLKTCLQGSAVLPFSYSLARVLEKNKDIKKPNIIFILADDLGWSDLGCYSGETETTNLLPNNRILRLNLKRYMKNRYCTVQSSHSGLETGAGLRVNECVCPCIMIQKFYINFDHNKF